MEDDRPPAPNGSDWNNAVGTIGRLDNCKRWLGALTVDSSYNPAKHYWALLAYYKELIPIAKDNKEQATIEEYFKTSKSIMMKYLESNKFTFVERSVLDEFEIKLRRLEQELDLNMPLQKDNLFGMARKR